jgi:RES domain-containing protein
VTSERTDPHDHEPVYRVVRAGWAILLDTSYSRRKSDNRWNPPDAFEVLYACCSEDVARAIALDTFRYAGIVIDDLQPEVRPQLAEIGWGGEVVDMASPEGVQAAGFPPTYPTGADHRRTQPCAVRWHAAGHEGVVCRSASMGRLGRSSWEGSHQAWSELAVFVEAAQRAPRLLRRRGDLTWLDRPTGRSR